MNSVRVGVVGSGWVANDRYLPVLSDSNEATLVGIADRNIERARESAGRYGTGAFDSHRDLLEHQPDAVFICTSPWSHREIAVDAANAGIHVFTEKPMAIDEDETGAMVSAAERAGVLLGVSHNFLYARSMRRARSVISAGSIGDLKHVYAFQASSPTRRLPRWYPDLRGGLFFDESPHMVYLIDHLIGDAELESAWAKSAGTDDVQPIEMLEARFSGSRATATLSMLFTAPVSEWLITAVGSRGLVSVDVFRDICVVLGDDGEHAALDILRTSGAAFAQHLAGVLNTGTRVLAKRQFWGHDVVIRDFIAATSEGRAPLITGSDGTRVVELMCRTLDAVGY